MSTPSAPASPLEALKAGFRRACVRRLVGDEAGAIDVLKNEIPKLVVGWAKTTSIDAAEKKGKLKEMFDDESGRADELATAFDLFAGRFEARVAELVKKELGDVCSRLEQIVDAMTGGKPLEPISLNEQSEVGTETEEAEDVQELDPPKGIGLRFDEIEEMIDSVLSED
ncbi:MAG: hypothetical protein CBC04_09315 [Verrucomicrobia bacterium TMED44]|nr:MAG: hypothetical protein CBC04_09315 [Verrucomicrobia bacterium TMED44]